MTAFEIHRWMLLVHITAASLGLAVFWVPMLSPKGGRLHRRAGWVYVWVMGFAVVLAMGLAAHSALNPEGARRAPGAEWDARNSAQTRHLALFLFYLAWVTFASGWHGMRALKAKRSTAPIRTPVDIALAASCIVASALLVWHGLTPVNPVFLGLSPLGFFLGYTALRFILSGPAPGKRAWWRSHLGGMIGTGIAAHTAFAVFGLSRLLDGVFVGWMSMIPWIAPTLIGVPVIVLSLKRYGKVFERHAGAKPEARETP